MMRIILRMLGDIQRVHVCACVCLYVVAPKGFLECSLLCRARYLPQINATRHTCNEPERHVSAGLIIRYTT